VPSVVRAFCGRSQRVNRSPRKSSFLT